MKPINSKERSSQVWQFLFIFFALCIFPMALIFFSYFVVPEKVNDTELQKLESFNNFEQSQKSLSRLLAEIDSNINLIVPHNLTAGQEMICINNVSDNLTKLKNLPDGSSPLIQAIHRGYSAHLAHVIDLNKSKDNNSQISQKLNDTKADLDKASRAINQVNQMTPTIK